MGGKGRKISVDFSGCSACSKSIRLGQKVSKRDKISSKKALKCLCLLFVFLQTWNLHFLKVCKGICPDFSSSWFEKDSIFLSILHSWSWFLDQREHLLKQKYCVYCLIRKCFIKGSPKEYSSQAANGGLLRHVICSGIANPLLDVSEINCQTCS